MEKQEMEMKRKLETEMEPKKCTNHWCNVFSRGLSLFSLVFYQAMVISLAL